MYIRLESNLQTTAQTLQVFLKNPTRLSTGAARTGAKSLKVLVDQAERVKLPPTRAQAMGLGTGGKPLQELMSSLLISY